MKLTLRNRAIAGIAFAALSMIIQKTVPANAAPPDNSGVSPAPGTQKPDLVVPTLQHYKEGTNYYMWATVKNKGNAASAPCKLRMKIHIVQDVNNSYVTSWQFRDVPALAPGQEYTAEGFSIGSSIQPGIQPRFMVDSEKTIMERNEYNNYGLYEF